ncbi:unnamed protein product, partial [Mesorhabditis belari]|uniref:Uncharacterized protein n=1 Tax=Mesorhabditis belari TaxID=2138241 RepID=A0AAF3J4V4_9BILA
MLQSMSAHLMAETQLGIRRGSTRKDALPGPSLVLPPPTEPPITVMNAPLTPPNNPIGWAMFNPLPLRKGLPIKQQHVVTQQHAATHTLKG